MILLIDGQLIFIHVKLFHIMQTKLSNMGHMHNT